MQEILLDIQTQKEILSTMPTNTQKNIQKYNQKIEELIEKYNEYLEAVKKEIKIRYEKEVNTEKNSEIEDLESKLNEIEENFDLLNKYKTSFEKMGFDIIVSKLRKYYEQNMDTVNEEIIKCLKIFKNVGIELQIEDFNYNMYSQEYMKEFLNKVDIDLEKLKTKFDDLYWKCPDIIIYIEMNIRYLYLKNQKNIDKYYKNKIQNFLKKANLTEEEVFTEYQNLKQEKNQLEDSDKHNLVNSFVNGKLNPKDYADSKIDEIFQKNLSVNINELNDDEKREMNLNIIKLINNLYEYKYYSEYKFIIDDIKEIYKNRDKYKNIYEEDKKSISDKEQKAFKLEIKNNKKGLLR